MKPFLEKISHSPNSSFEVLHTPNLNEVFYWHYHPEIELVFAVSPNGIRHVGSHMKNYTGSDLVLIGSNIPHLNFDYGASHQVDTVVIHLKQTFFDQPFLKSPEFQALQELAKKAKQAVAFYGPIKEEVGQLLMSLEQHPPFNRLLKLIEILGLLANCDSYELLGTLPINTDKTLKRQERIQKVFHYVEENYTQEIKIDSVAQQIGMSAGAFSRWFKLETGDPFINYVIEQRIYHAKNTLLQRKSVSEACYQCGFNNLSYFNRVFKKSVGITPKEFKRINLKK